MRILLLEDDPSTRSVYRECLQSGGHKIEECGTIASAMTILRTSRIDLLVIDLLIEQSNSLSIAQFAGYAAPNAEIILITGSGRYRNGEAFREIPGLTWMLRKPVQVGDLELLVEHANQRKLGAELTAVLH